MSENFSVVGFVARNRSKKFLPVLLCRLGLEFSDLTERHEVYRRKFSAIIRGVQGTAFTLGLAAQMETVPQQTVRPFRTELSCLNPEAAL